MSNNSDYGVKFNKSLIETIKNGWLYPHHSIEWNDEGSIIFIFSTMGAIITGIFLLLWSPFGTITLLIGMVVISPLFSKLNGGKLRKIPFGGSLYFLLGVYTRFLPYGISFTLSTIKIFVSLLYGGIKYILYGIVTWDW